MGLSPPRPGLGARFDTRALRPPIVAGDEAARLQSQPACAAALLAWCQRGDPVLAVAALQGKPAPGPTAWANALARQLDGGTRLEALGRAAGLAWRLRLKLGEAWPGRARQPGDPWDAGWALTSSDALLHWQRSWQPRRPTLGLAEAGQAAVLAPALATLPQQLAPDAPPVRWLWVGGDDWAPLPLQKHKVALFRQA